MRQPISNPNHNLSWIMISEPDPHGKCVVSLKSRSDHGIAFNLHGDAAVALVDILMDVMVEDNADDIH